MRPYLDRFISIIFTFKSNKVLLVRGVLGLLLFNANVSWAQLPSINFSYSGNTIGCAPYTINFNISNFSENTPNTTYTLNFGDGSPVVNYTQATLPTTISHTYTQISCGQVFNGNQNAFGATLTATNTSGTETNSIFPIRISKKPTASFSKNAAVLCLGSNMTFTNTSLPGVTYTNFGTNCNTTPIFYWQLTGPETGTVIDGALGTDNSFPGNTAAWVTGTSPLTMQFNTPGSYQMKLSIGNSCGIDDTIISFNVTSVVIDDEISNQSICLNSEPISLVGSPPGGTWSGPLISSTGIFSPISVDTFTVTYTFNGAACNGTDTKVITVLPLPVVNVLSDTICAGESATLIASASGAAPPYNFSWSPTTGLSATSGASVTASPTSTQTYTVTITSANSCSSTDQATVTLISNPQVNAGNDISVCGNSEPVQLSGFSPDGGIWSGDGVSSAGLFTPTLPGVVELSYSYCDVVDNILVEIIDFPVINAGPDLYLCQSNEPFPLQGWPAGGNWSGIYVDNNVISTNINVTATGVLTYTYTENGCIGTDQISVSISDTLNVQAGSDFEMCVGDSIQLNGFPSGGNWAGATGLSSSGLYAPLTSGVELLSYVISNTNCPTAADVMVLVADTPSVSFNLPGAVFCTADTDVPLSGGNPEGGTYSGEAIANNRMNPSLLAPGSYVVAYDYTAASGCTARDTALIRIEACTGMFQIGSITQLRVFPNPGKGMFHIEVAKLNAPAQLFVYNSSGELVATKSMNNRSSILDMSLRAPGIYFVRIEANGCVVGQQKMLVLE